MEEETSSKASPDDAMAEHVDKSAPAAMPDAQQPARVATPHESAVLQDRVDEPLHQSAQDDAAETTAGDGWEFEDSTLTGLADMQPSQARSSAGNTPPHESSSAIGIQNKVEDAHGNGSVAGMSPPGGGWEGESELNFPLDDVPKEPKSDQGAPSRAQSG